MKKYYTLLLLVLLCACLPDDDFTITSPETSNLSDEDLAFQQNFGDRISINIMGKVVTEDGYAVYDATVILGDAITTSDKNGIFRFTDVTVFENFAFIKVSKPDYLKGFKSIVPTKQGTVAVQVTLLKKNYMGTVESGAPSSLERFGRKISFSGDFIDSNGNPYNGAVEVSLNYLSPSSNNSFQNMPGMLLGANENNDAVSLETYGMMNVNLFSASGEPLNISEDAPATIEFPINYYQTAVAPPTINLWYFDEEVGYWKEEGMAYNNGTHFVAEVNHFSWWNCDLPLNYVNACFTLETDELSMPNFQVIIKRVINDQIIFNGITNTNGEECGPIPQNEQLIVQVYDVPECQGELLHEEVVGPFASDTSFTINVPATDYQETTIMASVTDCNNQPVNGYGFLYRGFGANFDDYEVIEINNGFLSLNKLFCNPENYKLVLYDPNTDEYSAIIDLIFVPEGITNLGIQQTCINPVGGVFQGTALLYSQAQVEIFGAHEYTEVNGTIIIGEWYQDSNISDLSSLNTLTKVTPLEGGDYSGALKISAKNLTSLNGLQNITSVQRLDISNCRELLNLEGLNGLNEIGPVENVWSRLTIFWNNKLESLQGLNNLNIVNGETAIAANPDLLNLGGLDSVTTIEGNLTIGFNINLTNLNALSNLTTLNGDFSTLATPPCNCTATPRGNEVLNDFCGLQNLFTNGIYQDVEIEDNAFNPTVQDIINGNCSQ
ncbi:MAG: hypothetical protein ACWA5P_14340 [bacterium]